jgi:hypothetical protein
VLDVAELGVVVAHAFPGPVFDLVLVVGDVLAARIVTGVVVGLWPQVVGARGAAGAFGDQMVELVGRDGGPRPAQMPASSISVGDKVSLVAVGESLTLLAGTP